jgi:hypothetical protein
MLGQGNLAMRIRMTLAALAALTVASGAAAQTPEAAVSPVKLALARQLIEASGGATQAENMFGAISSNIEKALPAGASPEAVAMARKVQADLREELVGMIPQMLEITVQETASELSEQELRDNLAWEQSPSGQSVIRKMPRIMQLTLARELPMITTMVPRLMQKTADRVCEEAHCTPEQREQFAAAMSKALHPASP